MNEIYFVGIKYANEQTSMALKSGDSQPFVTYCPFLISDYCIPLHEAQ